MAQGGTAGLMVSVSGIRGRVGEALTPEVVARYAAAFGAWSIARGPSRQIVVGRDSRVSGPMFHRIVVGTLQLVGCDVIDIGLTTTPGCQLAVEHHHAAGGLMLSASHTRIERPLSRGGGGRGDARVGGAGNAARHVGQDRSSDRGCRRGGASRRVGAGDPVHRRGRDPEASV